MSRPGDYWDRTLNLVGGCLPKSPGCDHCYAATLAGGQQTAHNIALYRGVTKRRRDGRYGFNGNATVLSPGHKAWMQALTWPGAAHPKLGPGKPSLIFVGDMSDLFYEGHPTSVI